MYNKYGTRAYLFDYGGTLDTGGCHWGKALWHAYEACRVPVGEEAFREAYVQTERTLGRQPIIQPGFTFRQTLEVKIRMELELLGCTEYAGEVLALLYEQTRQHTARSRAVLEQLHEQYPLGLVSNFYGNIHTVLAEFGMDGLFSHIVESAVVGVRKPDPRIFTLGVEALGLPPEAVTVVGDSLDKDIVPAKAAGCQTVWLKGEQWTEGPVDASAADLTITDLKQLT